MKTFEGLRRKIEPDFPALIANLLRQGTPRRVHHMELFHDDEVRQAIADRFDLMRDISVNDPDYPRWLLLRVNRFLGFDYVSVNLNDQPMPMNRVVTDDTAPLPRQGGRSFMDQHKGPITTWEEFEKYPWPDPNLPSATRDLEWWSEHLPEDMCLVSHTSHFAEWLSWLMGYETLSYALYDQRDLVAALADRILRYCEAEVKRLLQFDRVRMIWGSDDMGFRSGTLISPADTREFVLKGHKRIAALAHQAGRPYLLHCCGNVSAIMEDLIEDVKIDAKHSFEDTILDVREAKRLYGHRLALIGGVDVDFLCRADEQAVRARVRDTLDKCLPGGGYCLGTGNSVCNYIPLENYLAMVDEGRVYTG